MRIRIAISIPFRPSSLPVSVGEIEYKFFEFFQSWVRKLPITARQSGPD